jgi:hypothetical protein
MRRRLLFPTLAGAALAVPRAAQSDAPAARLGLGHALASAALPPAFPPVQFIPTPVDDDSRWGFPDAVAM